MTAFESATFGLFLFYVFWFFLVTALVSHRMRRRLWFLGGKSGVERVAAWAFRIAFAIAVCWPIGTMLAPTIAVSFPLADWEFGGTVNVIGHLLVFAGAMLAGAAQLYMGSSWRVGVSLDAIDEILTDGPFALSRNPVFLGQFFMFIGYFLAMPGLATGIAAILYRIAAEIQIRSEERVLAAKFGTAYLAYQKRVGRWIGPVQSNGHVMYGI